METVFAALTRAIEGSPWMAVMGAFGWGVASILLSPCHLSSVPLIVGFINGQGRVTVGRATATAAVCWCCSEGCTCCRPRADAHQRGKPAGTTFSGPRRT